MVTGQLPSPVTVFWTPVLEQDWGVLACWSRHGCLSLC
jgi:hypothetical protein